jgi:predicted permease
MGDVTAFTEPVYGVFVSTNYFSVLGTDVGFGRDFRPSDDTATADGVAVIVSDRLWRGRLGGRLDIIGHPIRINGQLGTIVGVAAPLFGGTLAGAAFDVWVPLGARTTLVASDAALIESRTYRWLDITGRRRPERTLSQAQEEFSGIAQHMANTYAESRGRTIDVVPLDTGTVQQLRPLFLSLLALSAVVLVIVCSNVANLLLVRGASRVREIAIRFALGATRTHVLSKLMLENAILAGAGAVLGLALTVAGRRALLRVTPQTNIPLNLETPLDFGVLVFLVVLTSATVMLFGLLPALITTRVRITEALRAAGRGTTIARTRVRSLLVSAQLALCLTTLVAGALFMRRAHSIDALDPGFADPGRVLLVQTEAAFAGYTDLPRWHRTLETIAHRVREAPGVRSATWATFVPLGFVGYTRRDVAVEGYAPQTGESMRVLVSGVGDGYFELMGVPILEGRAISADDDVRRPRAAVVNETFARRFCDASSPLGRRITVENRTFTIVGVARDGRYDYRLIGQPPEPLVYYAFAQWPTRFATLHARTETGAVAAAASIKRAISEVDPAFATLAPISLQDYVAGPLLPLRMGLVFLGVLATAALTLSAMGVQAIIAYGVAIRTREIGIRLTLGASPLDVAGLFLRQTAVMTGGGVLAGLACAAVIVPMVQLRFGYLATIDVTSIVWPVALLTCVGLAAGYLTASRATRVDPAHTLRAE